MIQTGFEKRVTVQQVIENQLPEFVLSESPKTVDFLKQYYISQEHQGGASDIAVNLDQYLKLDNLTPEVISGETTLYSNIDTSDTTVQVYSTKGFPNEYGLFKIDNEVFTYTGLTTNTFTGVVRGFSGITSYRTDLNAEELLFSDTSAESHTATTKVQNLSALFLKDFYRKLKVTLTPGLEDVDFQPNLDANNFIKEARSLYESKGTEESFRILFNALYGVKPTVVDLEQYLPKPSSAEFLRRELLVAERISGNPANLVGQTIRKSTDSATQGAVSEVEVFTRSGISTYYKIGLFVGYSDNALIEGTFEVQPKTKVINPVDINDSIITVDSTIGFGATGTLVSRTNIITYTSKSVNQFLGCQGVAVGIGTGDEIRTNETFVGYENGDLTKKVELRLGGVLSKFEVTDDVLDTSEEQILYVNHVGEKIELSETGSTDKELFANSWIYNTSCRFDVEDINTGSSTITLKSTIDKSQLKVGDKIDILLGDTNNIALTNAIVSSINKSLRQVQLNNMTGFTYNSLQTYTIRKKLNTATSSGTSINYGQNKVTTDIQNVYNEKDEAFYVASNSLPSYDITKSTVKYTISTGTGGALDGYNSNIEQFQIISFSQSTLDFITGDKIVYKAETTPLKGLEEGEYYVEVLSGGRIKLYESRGLIETNGSIVDGTVVNNARGFIADGTNNHSFVLSSQIDDSIHPQRLLKKFHHSQDITTGEATKTSTGSLGMLINGVEVVSPKSLDKVYYGPLDNITVYNNGKDYDVINPPTITISSGLGVTALARAVVSGSVKEVLVDPQDFDVVDVKSATISGGNGSGAVLEPMVGVRQREVRFDSRDDVAGGGVSLSLDTITFVQDHNFVNGEPIIYDNNGNTGLGTFIHNAVYYPEVISNTKIKVYATQADANNKTFALDFNNITGGQGVHKFRKSEYTKTLRKVRVIEGGSGYTNRKLAVNPIGVNSVTNTITFDNHGFNSGDKVVYTHDTGIGTILPLQGSEQYQIIKIDSNSFKVASAGVGGTITSNYERNNYVDLVSTGIGTQYFAYPDVTLTISATIAGVGTATQAVGVITAIPVVRGEIIDAYLYEKGTGYGSSIINFDKSPVVTVKSGRDAEFKPIIVGGKVDQVVVMYSGVEYTSPPDLTFVGVGSGVGARARAIVENGKVTNVSILNSGVNYDTNTGVAATSVGLNAFIESDIRALTINNHKRFGDEILVQNVSGLQYGYVGHSTEIGHQLGDKLDTHSPIIGWAYDGNPIYGPNGFGDPKDTNSSVKYLNTGYVLSSSDVVDRPPFKMDGTTFDNGFFIEDYKFDNSGDLDVHNGRYTKTPDFPNGVYAYFAGITTVSREAKYPYYIGDSYRSKVIPQVIDQSFDFNNSELLRNTLPYKAEDLTADNDFVSEPYEIVQQRTIVDSISKGTIDSFVINQSGDGYSVNDILVFDNAGTNGGGLNAYVSRVEGEDIRSIDTALTTYEDSLLIWDNSNQISVHISPTHALLDGDTAVVSGVSTFIANLTKSHTIGVTSESAYLIAPVAHNTTLGFVTDIYASSIPKNISIGSTVAIGVTNQEIVKINNIFRERKVLRIERLVNPGTGHTESESISKLADSFTIPLNSEYFDSRKNDKVYFNPLEAVGIGTTAGFDQSKKYRIGDVQYDVSVPHQSIYIPSHPFKDNQEVTFTTSTQPIRKSNKKTGALSNLPATGLYVINKGKDYIGLTTFRDRAAASVAGFNTGGFFFRAFTSNGDSRDWKYALESNYTQQTARIERITSTIMVGAAHSLNNGDEIKLSVKSNQSVGIGTSTAVRVKYNSDKDKIVINPTTFTGSAIIAGNKLTLTAHELKTGDKVFYSGSATGLTTNSYYVYRIDDDNFQLGQTRYDVLKEPPTLLSITAGSGGSGQQISKVNPRIEVVENNNLVFDVADTSLSGYNLKIYHDEKFKNELVSIGGTVVNFSAESLGGAVGCGTTSTLTLNYSSTLPSKLYYTLERGGYISTSDKEVANNSEIIFVPSVYTNTYKVAGIGNTTFQVSLKSVPESLSYNQTTSSQLKYSTSSMTAKGGVESVRATSGGLNYKKLPKFTTITSTNGVNADIIPESSTIGRIKEVTIEDPGFDYSADKTLRPEVFISPNITVIDRNSLTGINVLTGGSGYTVAPQIVVVDPDTNEPYPDSYLEAEIQASSITNVEILQTPKGLSDKVNNVFTINNSNGVGITKVESTGVGTAFFTLQTPIAGFTAAPFAIGDKVFIEGISLLGGIGTTSTGYNSVENNYSFFTVESVSLANPVIIGIGLTEVTSYAGIAITDTNGYGLAVNQNNYPTFEVIQTPEQFIEEERLYVLQGGTYVLQDLYITKNLSDQIKIRGTYDLVIGDHIRGKESGTIATIKELTKNRARFKIDYSLRQDKGWNNDIGKLNEDFQVLPDNDYYQNLSYTVKSPIVWDDLVNPVNRLLHTTGLKNFSDTGITTATDISAKVPIDAGSFASIDIIGEKRVDTVSDFDFALDIDPIDGKSRFIKFQNKRLSDYINNDSNRVLPIDDITPFFNKVFTENNFFTNLDTINNGSGYNRYLVQIVNPNNNQRQVTELITLTNNDGDIFTFEKGSIGIDTIGSDNSYDVTRIGDLIGDSDTSRLVFNPADPFNYDYDLKVIKNTFNTSNVGIGTTSFGFIDVIGSNNLVGVGLTETLFSATANQNEAFFANIEVTNSQTFDTRYVELYVDQDGTDTYVSDFYLDNKEGSVGGFIGTFGASIESGVVKVNFTNATESAGVFVKSRAIGFGVTSAGIGTYRYLTDGQSGGSEKTARYESKFAYTLAPATTTQIFSVAKADVTSIKSIVKVGYGVTSALHQLLSIHDGTDVYTTQYPFVSVGSTSGIGTFGSEFSGSNLILKFYPDAGINDTVLVQSYSELIQTDTDLINTPNDLNYGTLTENIITAPYNGVNEARINVTEFDANYNTIPIFTKTFNPGTSTVVNLSTGTFSIKDHFFESGEELEYEAVSTFSNITADGMQMSNGSNLPATVYAIKITNDEFKLSLTSGGAAITFNDAGEGNAHTLTMAKRASKTLLSVDGIVQSPITRTSVGYALTNNYGNISATDTFASLVGISSILPRDILKIDDEYAEVVNVGLGTTAVGPITGSGTYNLVELNRGFVGTTAAVHSDMSPSGVGNTAQVHLGSFNIVKSKLHFSAPPTGNNVDDLDPTTGLKKARSTFGGRVFLRQDYTLNKIYDNISKSFTGIGATYPLTVNGSTTTGIETGSGLVFINNMFQTPTTLNNLGNTYDFIDGNTATKARFTGITDDNGHLIISDYDVNQNQLPRGGIIVSLGSSEGIGYAQPAGAKDVDVVINSSGALTKVGIGTTTQHGAGYRGTVGIGVTDEVYTHRWVTAANNAVNGSLTPTDGSYDSFTGLLTLVIANHGLGASGNVTIANNSISFTCSRDNYTSTKTYPRAGVDPAAGNARPYTRKDSNIISVDVGHGGGRGINANVTATVGAGGTIIFGVSAGGSGYKSPRILAPSPSYHNLSIVGVSRLGMGMTSDTGKGLLVDCEVGPADPSVQSAQHGDAAELIEKNDIFIANLAVERMLDRFPTFSVPTGSQNCVDDVEDVVESVAFNLKYGGNDKVYDAGALYITGIGSTAHVLNEEEQTIYAFHEARDISTRVMRNQRVYKHLGAQYVHTYTSGTVTEAVVSGGNYPHTFVSAVTNAINGSLTPNGATYNAVTGVMTLTFASAHGVANNGNVTIANYSLIFTCARDNNTTQHAYPRTTDPASGSTLTATLISPTSFSVPVGTSPLVFKSVVAGAGAEATSYDAKTGDTVLNVGSNHGFLAPTTLSAPTSVTYAPATGVLTITINSHGLAIGDYIKIADGSIIFTCARDNNVTQHAYPRVTDPVSATWLPVYARTTNTFKVNVGQSSDTSTHTFVSATAGIEKSNSRIGIGTSKLGFKCTRDATTASPQGVSQKLYPRPGDPFSWNKKQISIASTTTSTITVNVGVSSTSLTPKTQIFGQTICEDVSGTGCANVASDIVTLVGVVTTAVRGTLPTKVISSFNTYEVRDFKISRPGYGFRKGDVFKPVGLVTDRALTTPKSDFSLTVVDTFSDSFAAWQFGELDYIDSIKDLQDGRKVRFPLRYNGDLLSFETNNDEVDLNALLLIFVNGIMQHPGKHYTFDGGTSFVFAEPPNAESTVSIFFYRGTRATDSAYTNIDETIKAGDTVQLKTTLEVQGQDPRIVSGISSSDKIRTSIYTGLNINETDYRLLDWTKQKIDRNIEGEAVYKSRDSIEALVYPTNRIIGDLASSGISSIYLDNAQFFNYEENESSIVIVNSGALIMQNANPVAAAVTATVSAGGTIGSLTVVSGGSGYIGSAVTVSIARPIGAAVTFTGGVGVYTGIATATIPVVNGSLSGTANIIDGGSGYIQATPPDVLVPIETTPLDETISGITTVRGFSGIVTGITTSHSGSDLFVNFMINKGADGENITNQLKVGYPIYITETTAGKYGVNSNVSMGLTLTDGVTSIDGHENSIVSIGTTNLDNIYKVHSFTRLDNNSGKFSVRVKTGSKIAGAAATSASTGSSWHGDIGKYSWGVLESTDTRTDGIGIAVTGNILSSGITTFPTIQRRGYGIRSNGALRKDLG